MSPQSAQPQHEAPFKPGRRMLNSCPWTQDTAFQERSGRKPRKTQVDMFEENFAGHTTQRIHKFDAFGSQRRHLGFAQAESEGLLGSDNHGAGMNPHAEHFNTHYSRYAGTRSGHTGKARKAALSQASVMDEIILGRDIDGSGEDPHAERMDIMCKDAAGTRVKPESGKERRLGLPMQDHMDEIVLGRTMDLDAVKAWEAHQRKSMLNWGEGAAGLSREDLAEKEHIEIKRRGIGTVVGPIVYGRELAIDNHFEEHYGDVPGYNPNSAMRIMTRSTSTPNSGKRASLRQGSGNDGGAAGRASTRSSGVFGPPPRTSPFATSRIDAA